jgi:hypothetical protein
VTTDLSDAAPTVALMNDLTERQQQILTFERKWWKYAGAKEAAIRDLFDCSATRYYQELRALIDLEQAYVYDPMLVKRLRRIRDERGLARRHPAGRRLG